MISVLIMATGGNTEQGLAATGSRSYAALLSSNLPSAWNKIVLEIVLEKDFKGPFNVSESDCARVISKLGLDSRPGVQVEAIQICPNGRGSLLITLKNEVIIENYCSHDVFEVSQSGIRAVHIKPASKRDVIVTVQGLHPNTRDDGVVDYLNKFGKVLTTKVVYPVYGEGPLKGFKNGDQQYKVELKPNSILGTYHVLDGQRVTVRYSGQRQTCARCFGSGNTCPGRGTARKREQEGGQRKDFTEYFRELWLHLGYSPSDVKLDSELEEQYCITEVVGGQFTPEKQLFQNKSEFSGVSIKPFPKDADNGAIVEFLLKSGLSSSHKDNISIKQNGTVLVNNLMNNECDLLIKAIHKGTEFGNRLYCNGIVARSPEKLDSSKVLNSDNCTVNTQVSNNCQAQPKIQLSCPELSSAGHSSSDALRSS